MVQLIYSRTHTTEFNLLKHSSPDGEHFVSLRMFNLQSIPRIHVPLVNTLYNSILKHAQCCSILFLSHLGSVPLIQLLLSSCMKHFSQETTLKVNPFDLFTVCSPFESSPSSQQMHLILCSYMQSFISTIQLLTCYRLQSTVKTKARRCMCSILTPVVKYWCFSWLSWC